MVPSGSRTRTARRSPARSISPASRVYPACVPTYRSPVCRTQSPSHRVITVSSWLRPMAGQTEVSPSSPLRPFVPRPIGRSLAVVCLEAALQADERGAFHRRVVFPDLPEDDGPLPPAGRALWTKSQGRGFGGCHRAVRLAGAPVGHGSNLASRAMTLGEPLAHQEVR